MTGIDSILETLTKNVEASFLQAFSLVMEREIRQFRSINNKILNQNDNLVCIYQIYHQWTF